MQHTIKQTLKYAAGLILVCVILAVIILTNGLRDKLLRVYFFDVGQGDAILISTPSHQDVLIDGGPSKQILSKLGEAMPFYDREINLVIISHPHSDHYQGIFEVIKNYKVDKVLVSDAQIGDKTYSALLEEIKKKNIPLESVEQPMLIRLGANLNLELLEWFNSENSDVNNASIVARLDYNDSEFLFPGDLGEAGEKHLIGQGADLSADVLKVGHHGSSSATSEEFLKAVNPEIAVIEVGKNNKYGHPSERIIKRLERYGAQVYRTDLNGDVTMKTDGRKLEVESNK